MENTVYDLLIFSMILQKTINAVVEFFQSNRGLDLEQITSATLMKLEEIKERTATGKEFDAEATSQLSKIFFSSNVNTTFEIV